jgi:hypothetical protein
MKRPLVWTLNTKFIRNLTSSFGSKTRGQTQTDSHDLTFYAHFIQQKRNLVNAFVAREYNNRK